ncbi:MAG: hypothetical protein C4293_17245, partial [Nitrospiraceae bacterium]
MGNNRPAQLHPTLDSGRVAPMQSSPVAVLGALVGIALLALSACDQLRLPRLSYGSDEAPHAPITVKFAFDEALRNATLEQSVCADNLWQGRLGQAVIKAFLETGRKRFAQAVLEPPEGAPKPATDVQPDLIVKTRLISKSFQAATRMGSSDQFIAQLRVELAATYEDGLGHPIAEAPLLYSTELSVRTPEVGSGAKQCMTGQLDDAMEKASEHLADRMVRTVYRLGRQQAP